IVNSFKGAHFVSLRPYRNTQKETDLMIITESGRDLPLILEDVTHEEGAHADTTVRITEGNDAEPLAASNKYATKDDLARLGFTVEDQGKRIETVLLQLREGLKQNKAEALLEDASTPRGHYKYNRRKAAK